MPNALRIGIIGLDTSHVTAFTQLLNDSSQPYHVPGGQVVVAYPGGSPDFELSISRVAGFTDKLRDEYGVAIVDSVEAVAEASDAILLESVDGRVHLEQFAKIAPYGKPVFIDKPLAVESGHAKQIAELAAKHNVPVMSTSALRFAEGLTDVLADGENGAIIGVDAYGPMAIQPTQPGFFWYGIHTVEMVFAVLGKDCIDVTVTTNDDHDLIVGRWADGRIATVRGNRKGNNAFGALVHREKGSRFVDVYSNPKPYYASLLERIVPMFRGEGAAIDFAETLQVIRFIEAANESRASGKTVAL
ncbi:Gfo/Idh/MocA family protein [Paenibacillus flagellatus]|uniref:Oxidoreductase n=1 Tax=Paenibacillus flagellatus TaxID=2211139 RepID=A0A2V5JZ12_9BACL|nr:Gfo/Idh/MocA family oxidoreductase [Paenibacillus flagellatus]PYI52048.1 oxidoreductase [Paenibacillus flagellatus]